MSNSISGLSKRTRIQDEILQSNRGKGQGLDKAPGQRRKYQDEIASPSPTQPPEEGVSNVKPPSTSTSSDLKSLAERYVSQYEQYAGKMLSSSDRQALVENVYNFYSDPSRAGRLEKVVIA